MKCQKCKISIPFNEEREHNGEKLCEDCYIDVLSPARFCDPWADYSAKSSIKANPAMKLNANQTKILDLLKTFGEVNMSELKGMLNNQISIDDIDRECAALNRMGRLTIKNKNQEAVLLFE